MVLTQRDENAKFNKEHISPFETLTISLGTRVGVGSIVGVAVAITMGGAGSIFGCGLWHFLLMQVHLLNALWGQVYKAKDGDNVFKGGPAYYVRIRLNSKALNFVFALCMILLVGLSIRFILIRLCIHLKPTLQVINLL